MIAEVQYNLDSLARACREYGVLSGKSEDEVLDKQGGKLSWNLYKGLRAIAPARGAVRAERVAALHGGGGIKIRDAVIDSTIEKYGAQASVSLDGGGYLLGKRAKGSVARSGKHLNFWALAAERELNLRESARGFSSVAVPRPVSGATSDYERDMESRYGFTLSKFQRDTHGEFKSITMTWLGRANKSYNDAVTALSTPREQAILAEAVRVTTADIQEYVKRKQEENIRQSGLE